MCLGAHRFDGDPDQLLAASPGFRGAVRAARLPEPQVEQLGDVYAAMLNEAVGQ